MKHYIIIFFGPLALMFFFFRAHSQAQCPFTLVPVGSARIPLTTNEMTNLIFPVNIQAGIKVSREVAVQKVKGVENVLELKALHVNFTKTNLSVFGQDGNLYCFELTYEEQPAALNFKVVPGALSQLGPRSDNSGPVNLSALPRDVVTLQNDADTLSRIGSLHVAARDERIRLKLKGIFMRDSLLWFSFTASNRSGIAFEPDHLRAVVRNRKKAKRSAVQEVEIVPIFSAVPPVIDGRSEFSVAYQPFTVSKSKVLELSLTEKNGGRSLVLDIKNKSLLRARQIE